MKQGTFNLIIIMAVAVIAAGAWSTPMLVVQTGHTLIDDINNAESTLNAQIDLETSELDDIFGVTGGFDEAGCTIADMMAAFATDTDIGVFCDEDLLDTNFIQASANFKEQNNQFDVDDIVLINSKGLILPFRDCDDVGGNTVNADQSEIFASEDTSGTALTVSSTNTEGQFGTPVCLHTLSSQDSPTILQTVTIEGDAADAQNVRIQVAIITDGDDSATGAKDCFPTGTANDDEANFNANVIFDATVFLPANDRITIPAHFMGSFPPDDQKNVCVRIAGEDNEADDFLVWLSVKEEGVPLEDGVFNFIPQFNDSFFAIDHISFSDFSDQCGLIINVQDAVTNANLENIPIAILEPFIPGLADTNTTPADSASDDQQLTDASGNASFLTGPETMPSGFYIIDVNVDSHFDNSDDIIANTTPNSNYLFLFADQFIDCGGAGGDKTINVTLTPREDKDVKITAFNSNGGTVSGIGVHIQVTPFNGNPVNVTGNTGADGSVTFSNIDFGFLFININNAAATTAGAAAVNTGFSGTTEFGDINQFSLKTTNIGGTLVPQ